MYRDMECVQFRIVVGADMVSQRVSFKFCHALF